MRVVDANEKVARLVEALRAELVRVPGGVSTKRVAERVGVSQATARKWLNDAETAGHVACLGGHRWGLR